MPTVHLCRSIDNVPSPAACCATCSATLGCKSFTYVTATDPNNAGAAIAQRCYLKSGAGTNPTPYAQCTSGVPQATNTTVTPVYCAFLPQFSRTCSAAPTLLIHIGLMAC